jgi:hypothetical protein
MRARTRLAALAVAGVAMFGPALAMASAPAYATDNVDQCFEVALGLGAFPPQAVQACDARFVEECVSIFQRRHPELAGRILLACEELEED